jgi:hypothetical protein
MIKKVLDAISITSLAIVMGVGIWLAIWGEAPRAPGHLSIQSKIIAWNVVPGAFGLSWLIVRYANSAREKFPRIFGGPDRHGLLFYFGLVLAGVVLLEPDAN